MSPRRRTGPLAVDESLHTAAERHCHHVRFGELFRAVLRRSVKPACEPVSAVAARLADGLAVKEPPLPAIRAAKGAGKSMSMPNRFVGSMGAREGRCRSMSVFGRLAAVATALSASACSSTQGAATDGGAERSLSVSGSVGGGAIGDPCVPSVEYDPTFSAFDFNEVSVETHNTWCATPVCLVNHFQGRVSCLYGQAADGSPRVGTSPECTARNPITGGSAGCCTPGGAPKPVTGPLTADGKPADAITSQTVPAQCTLRSPQHSVYCSCRCANVAGATDDGASYCSCPAGFSCTQLVISIGPSAAGEALSGAYCMKNGTAYDPNSGCGVACAPPGTSGSVCVP